MSKIMNWMMHLLTGDGKDILYLKNKEFCSDDTAALHRGTGECTSKVCQRQASRVGVQKYFNHNSNPVTNILFYSLLT